MTFPLAPPTLNVCAHFALACVCVCTCVCVRVSDSVRDKSLFNFAKKRVEKLSTFVAIYFKKAKDKVSLRSPLPPPPRQLLCSVKSFDGKSGVEICANK